MKLDQDFADVSMNRLQKTYSYLKNINQNYLKNYVE